MMVVVVVCECVCVGGGGGGEEEYAGLPGVSDYFSQGGPSVPESIISLMES